MALRMSTRVLAAANTASKGSFLDSMSGAYINWSGYRKYGLRAEDLVMEELPGVKEALQRMPQDYHDERFFRLKRATNTSIKQSPLPKNEWLTEAEDTQELIEMIKTVRTELDEQDVYNERH